MEQGKVVIGTKLNTADFDKDISKIEKRLEELDKKSKEPFEINGIKVTGANNLTDEELNEYNDLQQKLKELYNQKMELNKVEKAITQELNNQEAIIDKQKSSTQEQVSNNSTNASKITEMSRELEEMVQEYNAIQKADIISSKDLSRAKELKKDIKKTAKEIEKLGGGKISIRGITDIPKQFNVDGINKGLTNTIKKVAKWGLALFGIRTAYNAIRGAMITLSQYDTQMADNIEYIRYALASSLQPVIQTILNLVIKLLQYINYIAKAWTGKNLFKTADTFKSAQKSASGVAKSAKEINKQLAGFDEMNVLSDNSSAGGGGADISAPNIDLTGMQGEVPSWVQWIVDNKDLIIAALFGIAGGIIAIKLGADLLMGLGIGLIIAGIVKTVKAIIDFIKDPSWDNFAKILEGLTVILTGVAIAMLAVNAANPVAWIVLAIAAVVALAAVVIKNWDKIKEVLGTAGQWIYDHIIKPVADFFSGLWQGIKDGVGSAVQWVKDKFKTIVDFFGNLISKIVGLFKKIGTKVGDAISGAFKAVINGVLKAIENILNFPIKSINKLINVINKVPGINLGKLPTFKLPRLAKGGIINQPGRGIPVGSAIGGERGQEGVIPLTDSQQMQLLGEAIGRYVNINLTNITKLDNRQIAKEQRKINAQNDFAFNR